MMIKLTIHAQEALELRGLKVEWIEGAVSGPTVTRPDPRRPGVTLSFRAIAESGNKVLRVAHRPEGDTTLIITAHFDRGAKL